MPKAKKIKTSGKFKQSMGRKVAAKSNKARKLTSKPKTPARAKNGRLINVTKGKRFQQFLKNYDEAVARGDIKPIKEIEELRNKWGGAWNKDGSVKQSALRSNKRRKEFNADMKAFNKKFRKWGKKAVKEMGEKQREKERKKLKQGADTYKEHEIKRKFKQAQEDHQNFDFEEAAKQAIADYKRMVDMFANDSFNKLREELNIGSPVVQALAAMGYSIDDLQGYFEDFRNAYMNIPQEARDLASQDDINEALLKMVDLVGQDNLVDTLDLYLSTDDEEERELIIEMSLYHAENADNTNKSFKDFYNDTQNSIDPYNKDSWSEAL